MPEIYTSSKDKRKVSVIIPTRKIDANVKEALPFLLDLDWPNLEILILPDNGSLKELELKPPLPWVKVIPTGPVGPAQKRDLGGKFAKGEILAFIDSDAYPTRGWLVTALKYFQKAEVGAVGGPAVTPKTESLLAKASAAVLESALGAGALRSRYLAIGYPREINDWPTVNFIVRTSDFERIGGFDIQFWPGEDTKLCLDLIKLGKKIIYEPTALVFHHRRTSLKDHFKQVAGYGIHRGYFAKRLPQTSLRLTYFLPLVWLLWLISLLVLHSSFFILPSSFALLWYFRLSYFLLGIYGLVLLIDSISAWRRHQSSALLPLTFFLIPATHFWYAINFLKGLLLFRLER